MRTEKEIRHRIKVYKDSIKHTGGVEANELNMYLEYMAECLNWVLEESEEE